MLPFRINELPHFQAEDPLQIGLASQAGAGQVAAGINSVGNQAVTQRIGRALDTRPTIEVDAGQLCHVLLTKPPHLPALWQYGDARALGRGASGRPAPVRRPPWTRPPGPRARGREPAPRLTPGRDNATAPWARALPGAQPLSGVGRPDGGHP